jgi:hypothetical protein
MFNSDKPLGVVSFLKTASTKTADGDSQWLELAMDLRKAGASLYQIERELEGKGVAQDQRDAVMGMLGQKEKESSMWPNGMGDENASFDKSSESKVENPSNNNKVVNKNIITNEETLTTKQAGHYGDCEKCGMWHLLNEDDVCQTCSGKKADAPAMSEGPRHSPTYKQVSAAEFGPGERVTVIDYPGWENFIGQKGTIEAMGASDGYWVVRLDNGQRTVELPKGALESENRR